MRTSQQILYLFNKLHRVLKLSKRYRFSKIAQVMEVGTLVTLIINIIGLDTIVDTFKLNKFKKADVFKLLFENNTPLPLLRNTVYKLINNKLLLNHIVFMYIRFDETLHELATEYDITIEDLYKYKFIVNAKLLELENELRNILFKKVFINTRLVKRTIAKIVYSCLIEIIIVRG